jgi:hypothetical protein
VSAEAPGFLGRRPGYPALGPYVGPMQNPEQGGPGRHHGGCRWGFRGPGMYQRGYRGYSYRGGMW